MGSRTRQTRAVVSYKLDSSSDDSDGGDASFRVQRSARNAPGCGNSSNGELEASSTKSRRSLALKKSRHQERGGVKDEDKDKVERSHLDHNDVSGDWATSGVPADLERSADGNVPNSTNTTSFQRLVDAAFEADDVKGSDCNKENAGAVEDGRQMQTSTVGEERPQQPHKVENSDNSKDDQREFRPASRSSSPTHRAGRDHAAKSTPAKSGRPRSKKSSKSYQTGSDDEDDWMDDDFGDGDVSDSASDFSRENVSDSDADVERPTKKRQTAKSASAKKLRPSAVARTSVTKGPRTKGGAADRKVPATSEHNSEITKTPAKSVGRPWKTVSSCVKSVSSSIQGTGATAPSMRRVQPVKMRLKMASKEAGSDESLCGSAGRVPLQLISASNLQHRRKKRWKEEVLEKVKGRQANVGRALEKEKGRQANVGRALEEVKGRQANVGRALEKVMRNQANIGRAMSNAKTIKRGFNYRYTSYM
ncbi:hypothetical protein R1flu_020592 [Riccia fluitans]|uniref:Uncharacterized protein n=1 Tax=Riccia fluitans TaxID=41844 RepID=A0ABD1ZQE9_9MARC